MRIFKKFRVGQQDSASLSKQEIKQSKIFNRAKRVTIIALVMFILCFSLFEIRSVFAVNEYNYDFTVTIDLDGGSCGDIYYMSNVDRDGCGHSGGDWESGLAIGGTYLDKHGYENTISDRGADSPGVGTFHIRADAVGITPHVIIENPSRPGYTFEGWSTNTSTTTYNGHAAFNIGCWSPSEITITATWSKNTYTFNVEHDNGFTSVSGAGEYTPGSTAHTTINLKQGYEFSHYTESDEYYNGKRWESSGNDSWNMYGNRSVYAHSKLKQYRLNVIERIYDSNTRSWTTNTTFTKSRAWITNNSSYIAQNISYFNRILNWGDTYKITASSTDSHYTTSSVSKGTIKNNKTAYIDVYPIQYTIKYHYGLDDNTVFSTSTFYYDANKVEVISDTPSKVGSSFNGWKYRDGTSFSGGTGASISYKASSQTIDIYADWIKSTYEIEFDGNGATEMGTRRIPVTYGEAAENITIPKRYFDATFKDSEENRDLAGSKRQTDKFLGYELTSKTGNVTTTNKKVSLNSVVDRLYFAQYDVEYNKTIAIKDKSSGSKEITEYGTVGDECYGFSSSVQALFNNSSDGLIDMEISSYEYNKKEWATFIVYFQKPFTGYFDANIIGELYDNMYYYNSDNKSIKCSSADTTISNGTYDETINDVYVEDCTKIVIKPGVYIYMIQIVGQ